MSAETFMVLANVVLNTAMLLVAVAVYSVVIDVRRRMSDQHRLRTALAQVYGSSDVLVNLATELPYESRMKVYLGLRESASQALELLDVGVALHDGRRVESG
jgi:hypothetical protein